MSTENHRSEPTGAELAFTIYPGYQGTVEHGLYQDPSQAPPPKYEDVISGEYLKQNYTTCQDTTSPALSPGWVWMCSETTTPRPPPPSPQTEPLEVNKKKKVIGVLLFTVFLIVILIFRVYCFI